VSPPTRAWPLTLTGEARINGHRYGSTRPFIFRAAAPIVHSVAPLTEAQRGKLLPNIVRVMLAAFVEEQVR
jgi:hypothetical protein